MAASFGSIKLFRLCGDNTGLVEVSVGPRGQAAYVAVLKPGYGFATVQALTFSDVPLGSIKPCYPAPPLGSA